jgi:hypothetical protein
MYSMYVVSRYVQYSTASSIYRILSQVYKYTNILLLPRPEDRALHNLMPGMISAPRHHALEHERPPFAVWENPLLHDWGGQGSAIARKRTRLGDGYRTGLCKGRAATKIAVASRRGRCTRYVRCTLHCADGTTVVCCTGDERKRTSVDIRVLCP